MAAQLLMINPKKRSASGRFVKSKKVAASTAKPKTKTIIRTIVKKAAPKRRRAAATIKVKRNPSKRKRSAQLTLGKALIKQALVPSIVSSVGAIALDVAVGYANRFLPPNLQSGIIGTGVKGIGAVGLGMLAAKFKGNEFGKQVMIGGLTVTLHNLMQQSIIASMPSVPMAGMGVYDNTMGVYDNTMGVYDKALGFYSPAALAGVEEDSFVSYDEAGLDRNGNFNIMDYSRN